MFRQTPPKNAPTVGWGRPFWMTVLLGLACCVGCGKAERPYTDNSRDPESFAADVKTVVLDHVALARRSKEPADELQQVVNFLADRAKRPQGNYAELYDKLFAMAEQIHQACEAAGGKSATLTQQLAELEELAETLPGRVDTAVGQVDAG